MTAAMEVGGLTLKKSNLQDLTFELTQPLIENGRGRIAVAGSYDVDMEHAYIMTKALRSYRRHRDEEMADIRPRSLTAAYNQKDMILPSRKPITGLTCRPNLQTSATAISGPWRTDAIAEVQKANPAELIISSPKKVLNTNLISLGLSMDHSKQKPRPSPKRRTPAPRGRSSAQAIPQRQRQERPQSCYASSCPQPRSSRTWPWNQHYGKDTCPWSRNIQPNSSPNPRRREIRASSDTSANRLMTSSMSSTDRPNSSRLPYGDSVFGPSSHTAKRGFFVIHPDWVSESMTVQKLTLNDRKSRPIIVAPPVSRRCRSAPPPRLRNPITWQT